MEGPPEEQMTWQKLAIDTHPYILLAPCLLVSGLES